MLMMYFWQRFFGPSPPVGRRSSPENGPFGLTPKYPKIVALRRIGAWAIEQPIAGLRSSGKGANRTILDCSLADGVGKDGLSAAAGVAGAGSLPARSAGSVPPGAAYERVWNRDDSVFGGS